MAILKIRGMSCAACSARVERALLKTEGVEKAAVNLLTNSAEVVGSASISDLVESVRRAGYDAELVEDGSSRLPSYFGEDESGTRFWSFQIVASFVLLVPLFYFATGVSILGFPVPNFCDNPVGLGVVQLCLAGASIFVNRHFFKSGLTSLRRLAPNMDSLVSLGSGVSFLFSFIALILASDALAKGSFDRAVDWGRNYYFESSAAILFFISLGKALEARAKGKTTSALRALSNLIPERAIVEREGEEVEINATGLRIDDVFLVKPGSRLPGDGVVVEGASSVDESALTGESVPVDKQLGDLVYAGTVNTCGYLKCRVVQTGTETALGQIMKLTVEAASSKAPVARLADKIAGVFVPSVMLVALATFLIWLAFDRPFAFALVRGITVLTISCPCALGLAVPVATMVGMGVGARRGVLFKTAEALELCGKVRAFCFDKTGVITEGKPRIVDFLIDSNVDEFELFKVAFSLESKSEHPLALAIVDFIKRRDPNLSADPLEDFVVAPGNGLAAICRGETILGGKVDYIAERAEIAPSFLEKANVWASEGKTPVFFARGAKFLGAFAASDSIKADAAEVMAELKRRDYRVSVLTGDSKRVADAVAREIGVTEVVAEATPDVKERVVRKSSAKVKTAFIGDGINDAPALTRADVGVAIGAGTDVAIDAADVVLVSDRLTDVVAVVRLSRATLTNVYENLFWAFCYNIVGIPLAAGFLEPLFGWTFSPAFGAFAMSASSLCVVLNALRLNWFDFDGKTRKTKRLIVFDKSDSKLRKESVLETRYSTVATMRESLGMKKIMKVKGMMCPHCEARVKKALESLTFVESASADSANGTVEILLKELPENGDSLLRDAVTEQGYETLSIV